MFLILSYAKIMQGVISAKRNLQKLRVSNLLYITNPLAELS